MKIRSLLNVLPVFTQISSDLHEFLKILCQGKSYKEYVDGFEKFQHFHSTRQYLLARAGCIRGLPVEKGPVGTENGTDTTPCPGLRAHKSGDRVLQGEDGGGGSHDGAGDAGPQALCLAGTSDYLFL